MPLLVTSASGANGDGFGALLSFELDGTLRGTFIDDDRIVDPRGLAIDPNENSAHFFSARLKTRPEQWTRPATHAFLVRANCQASAK